MTTLRFIGDWSPWVGLPLAAALAWAAWALYRRETRARTDWTAWGLPALRAAAVALLALMVTGPALHHRRTVGRGGRVLIAMDGSASMSVNDAAMSPGRKLLAAASLGLMPLDGAVGEPLAAERALLRARMRVADFPQALARGESVGRAAEGVIRETQGALDHVEESMKEAFRAELLDPAFALERKGESELPGALTAMAESLEAWRGRVRQAAETRAAETARRGGSGAAEALKKFDAMPRWRRMQALLFGGQEPLLRELARGGRPMEVVALQGEQAAAVWSGTALIGGKGIELPKPDGGAVPEFPATDLDAALKAALARGGTDPLALVLLSDGRHNHGGSPLASAQACGERGIAVFAVGMGTEREDRDMAIERVEAPEWVYHKDHLKGRIWLKEAMAEGKAFKLRVACGERTLWEKELRTTGERRREVEFDFSPEAYLNEALGREPREVTRSSAALDLRVSLEGLGAEDAEPRNNAVKMPVRATFHKNRILILDGRPRWEFRYLRDLFERDAKWEVTTALATGGELRRGDDGRGFPSSREKLFTYDLVMLGDFPPELLRAEELGWLRAFVGERGGGIIFIDGERGCLRRYGQTPLAEVMPVAWSGAAPAQDLAALRLTEKGKLRLTRPGMQAPALTLAAETSASVAIWDSLLPPHWLAQSKPLPGAETLLEAVSGEQALPALVSRRYGSGKALYAAFDESWRFRYRVEDLHHSRYWSQVAGWIMAQGYAASDKYVSLDAGALTHPAGGSVELRARVRDGQGREEKNAKATGIVTREGREVARIPLEADAESGEYLGKTGALEAGRYEVRLEAPGRRPEELKARTEFYVEAPRTGELVELSCDEALLRRLAEASGGEYFREEHARELAARVASVMQPQTIERETALWQSWWWFGALALLFSVEWAVRKRKGML